MEAKLFSTLNETESSRCALVGAAKKIFAQRGLDGASLRDIAAVAGVNLSLISYYFKGKEGLYRACLESFGKNVEEILTPILKRPESEVDFQTRLKIFVHTYLNIHLAEPELSIILHRDFTNQNPIAQEVFASKFRPMMLRISEFFNHAMDKKFIREQLDVELTTHMLMGTLVHLVRTRHQQAVDRLDAQRVEVTVDKVVDQICAGIMVR